MRKTHPLKALSALILACVLSACGGGNEDRLPPLLPAPAELQSYGGQVEYRVIEVPEDHADPAGRQIGLAVGILKATTPGGKPPILMLSGGPGDSAIVFFDYGLITNGFAEFLRADRDVILLDQRGTGFSSPGLFCEAGEATVACRQRLAAGADLSKFDTGMSARDVALVLDRLRIPRVDVYGVSFGTFLAQEVMRRSPERIRSVILDSVVPTATTVSRSRDAGIVYQHAYARLFADCDATTACRAAFPDLERVFYGLLERAGEHPVEVSVNTRRGVQTFRLDDLALLANFENLFSLKAAAPHLPAAVYAMSNGVANAPSIDAIFGIDYPSNARGSATGAFRSMLCRDVAAFDTLAEVLATNATLHPVVNLYTDLVARSIYGDCDIWSVGKAPGALRQTVTSTLPTLVLGGEFDARTDPEWVGLVGRSLANSHAFVFPRTGHGVIQQGCAQAMIRAFLDDPSRRPDASSCMTELRAPAFYALR